MDNETSQTNHSGRGGKRVGAGRKANPEGIDYAHKLKRKIQTYFEDEDVERLIDLAFEQAQDKPELLKFLLEQIFGKARQNLGIDGGEEGKALIIHLSEAIAKKNDINTQSE